MVTHSCALQVGLTDLYEMSITLLHQAYKEKSVTFCCTGMQFQNIMCLHHNNPYLRRSFTGELKTMKLLNNYFTLIICFIMSSVSFSNILQEALFADYLIVSAGVKAGHSGGEVI